MMKNRDSIVKEAILLAQGWQNSTNALITPAEKARNRQLARLMNSPLDKVILTQLIDQSFRSSSKSRVADQICYLMEEYGMPAFFTPLEKLSMYLFLHIGRHLPEFSVPLIIKKLRKQSVHAIIPGEPEFMQAYLLKRQKQGVRVNLNQLGEAILGEEEALSRLKTYLEDLRNPAIEYISIKISTIYSQIHPLDFDQTVNILKDRLSRLYRAAIAQTYTRSDGSCIPKFINLDMESYQDMEITTAAFTQSLDQKAFKKYFAGMALQAYIPDSHDRLQQITAWARKRVAAGGSPIKIRIVKGANMEMEQVEAALMDWPLAPYDNKTDVDANYKRMVEFGLKPENIKAVRLGVASHNLFDLAYAYLLAKENGVADYFSFEMLEGMANHVRRALQKTGQEVLIYAPAATEAQFINAVAYLIRRLDENTGENNFLRYLSRLKTGTHQWRILAEQFSASAQQMRRTGKKRHRVQDRLAQNFCDKTGTCYEAEFKNEPNTDWSLPANREWAEKIRAQWKKVPGDKPLKIPLVVAGAEVFENRSIRDGQDPSQYSEKVIIGHFAMAAVEDIEKAVDTATADPDGWRKTTIQQRHKILSRAAVEIRKARGDLIGAAAANTGKVFAEADVEVSEAVDFTEYYPFSARAFSEIGNVHCHGKGVGVVISPWNFPIAIPCGGIAASLSAGNTVILKPSSEAVLVAWLLCQCFWRAGVSKNVLQFLPCEGSTTGQSLIRHPDIDFIILTGGTATGLNILKQRPDVFLAAETGGKNATVVTAMSDRDQAIRNVMYSAFGNGGQKCSATSLLILEREVYQDSAFKRQLVDAAKSFRAGSAWNFASKMGPLIHPPRGDLKNALTRLEPGETWALKPQNIGANPHTWTPGIKWDVRPDSYTHMTEFFGPLLAVMCAENLDHAVEIVNHTGYGLTSGLESLDKREQEYWKDRIKAGNLYINRGTTGAITLRQPFGGMGKSAIGAGIKAGGPKYVAQFMNFEETGPPLAGPVAEPHTLLRLAQHWQKKLDGDQFEEFGDDLKKTIRAIKSYIFHVEREFSRKIDYFHLRGQDNILRYLPVGKVIVRLHRDDSLFDILARIAAVKITGCELQISIPANLESTAAQFLSTPEGRRLIKNAPIHYEQDVGLIEHIPEVNRIRYAAPQRPSRKVLTAAAQTGFYIARTPVMMDGGIELLQYYQQQSICHTYHRYGNLGERALQYDSC